MVICAGPTGAGKTTTLYSTLLEINEGGKNVTTVEDPGRVRVPRHQPGPDQRESRSDLRDGPQSPPPPGPRRDPRRRDPRRADTARIAIQSALTGHFVLSSLHGTDAVAALHRLLDMGIEAFLVASAIVGVVSQRLIRKMCDNCKEQYELGPEELAVFRQHSGGSEKTTFWRGAGCTYCGGTGYRDRIGIYELLRITPEIRRLIVGWGDHRRTATPRRCAGHAHHASRSSAARGRRRDHRVRSRPHPLRPLISQPALADSQLSFSSGSLPGIRDDFRREPQKPKSLRRRRVARVGVAGDAELSLVMHPVVSRADGDQIRRVGRPIA